MKWFVYDKINNEFEVVESGDQAREEAEQFLKYYRDNACSDGWPEDMRHAVGYGPVIVSSDYEIIASRDDYTDSEWEEEGYGTEWDHVATSDLVTRKKHERKEQG